MRKLKLFLSLLMLIAFSVGNVWAADYQLVNSTDDLEANANYVIGNAASGSAKFMATTENSDNRKPTDEISITSGKITATNAVLVLKLEGSAEAWKFKTTNYAGTDGYLYNAESGTGNKCYVGATEREFTISFSGDAAVITATGGNARNILRWNTSGLFACYGSGQQPVYLFKEVSVPTVKYTVSFNTGAGNPTVSPIPETTAGQGITLPAGPTPACSADGWTFAGWAAAAVASETTIAPTLLAAGTNYKPTEDVTLFAVYKRTESGDAEWKFAQVTSLAQINAGGTFIITNGSKYLPSTTTTSSVAQADMVAITNGVVTGTVTDAMKWTFSAADGDGYVNVTNSDGKYLYATNSNSGLRVNTTEDSWKFEEYTVSDVLGFAMKEKTYSRYCAVYTDGSDWRPYTSKNATNYKTNSGRLDIYKYTEVTPSTTYYLSTPSCCTKHDISIASGIEDGSISADLAEACEGTIVTLTFTPATNYHLSAWTLNGAAQDVNVNTFSMPAGAATVSATFEQDNCDPLAEPVVTVSGKAYPYDAIKLAWTAIEHADAYKVYIYDNEDNELEHNDAFAGVEYTIGQTLSASTTYKYSVQAISNTPATYCPSTEAESTFTTDALPTAHLTLIALGEEQQASGDYSILTPFNLPSTAAACSKTFMGWDANSDCATDPTYAKGAEFTFQNTTGVTLYAVYADETPGEATLTKMTSADALADGDKVVIVANGTQYGVYQETQSSSYVKNWELAASTPAISELGAKKIWNVTADNTNWKFGDATNGYLYTSGSNNLAVSTDNATSWSVTWNESENGFILKSTGGRYFACRTDLTGDNANLYRMSGTSIGTNGVYGMDIYKYATSASTYDNYSTTCVAAPTAEPASASIAVAAAGGEGTLGVTYENVNLAGVTVALFNNEACSEAFDGGWLTASIAGGDKHIAYNAQANTSYNDARTAYIKLTAPETNGAANPAVVVIPVEQAKKPAVFASLEDLVEAELESGTEVTVSFSNVMITEVYETNAGYRYGLYLNVKDKDGENDIELFYNKQGDSEQVPDTWVKNGYVSATNLVTTWTEYKGQWELAMQGATWSWENGDITYAAPKAVSSVVVSGAPTKTSYVDGEKFAPAGLTVTINYNDYTSEVNPVGVTFACTPERVAKGASSVEVVATFNEIDSDPFEVTGLTVGDIQLKTIEEFIAAGDADMRCYLEGIVSDIETGTKLKYGNFNLTDASGTIYVYGCLNQAGEAQKFDELDIHNGDKIKVIAEDYDYYNSKHEAKNVQFVSKTSPVDITITSGSTVEKGKTLTLTATTDPAAAIDHISYSVKVDGNEGNVSLSDNVLTGVEVGEATIIASIPDGEGYIANSVEFTVEVTAAIVHGSITYVENGANEDIDDVADATALPDPLPTVTKVNFLFGGWYTDAEFNTPAVAGAALSEDVTLYAKWNAIPYYATVYTSNVDFVGGGNSHENNSKVVINTVEYKAQKVGASSNTGTVTVTVPAYTHTLHFHVFTWKDRANVLSISSDDVTNLSASTIDVNGDAAGAASTPYTINSNPVDHYQYITFDPIATEAEITFSWSSGNDKRFVMYGINQEGGVLPELDHIVITGNASTTEYEAGDEFDPAGLGVNAIYTLADVEQDPVAVDAADIEWSFAPAVLTAETESVTVTATYKGKQANKNVNVTVTVPTTPEIIATPASINFGIVNQNATVEAQGISVTLKAVAAATVTLDGDGFSIDKATLTELNSTITVTPVTTATGTFAATITISDDADVADDVVINLSMKVEPVEDLGGTWIKATSVAVGDRIIVGATVSEVTKTMGGQNTNNRAAVTSTLADGVLTPAEGTKTFLVVDAGDGKFALQALNGKYLTASGTGTKNYLTETADYEADNAKWTISFEENEANVVASSSNRNTMRYNSGDGLFSCYATGGQRAINIYKQGTPEPTYTEVRNGLNAGEYYTMCLDKAVTDVRGGSIWRVLSKAENGTDVILEEVEGTLDAGRPYIFFATATTLEVAYTGAAVGAPITTGNNGLVGSFSQAHIDNVNTNYIIYNNELYYVNTDNVYVGAHRAYIDMTAVPDYSEPQQGNAPRRRVTMHTNAPQVATGIDALNASDKPVKMVINGQLFIIRGEKMYNVNGQLVK